MNARPIRSVAGFTLIEAMIVVVIIGVLATFAFPSFTSSIESQRATATSNDLNVALSRTRSEAIKQNASVSLSPKSGNWANGWRILDPATNALIDDHDAIKGLTVTGPADVTYQSSGRLKGGTAPSFSITGNYTNSARCVSVDLSGRPNVKRGSC